ncbi:MAG: Hpt domain-containing protein [Gammaproteobacteria bacterium]|nr:Hpt domain-containing protein [Gammaproteobacteria bacterium]
MNDNNSIDLAVVETLKGLMKDKFNFLITTFIDNANSQLEQLQTAINSNEVKDIIALTHSMKGSSGSVGASKMHVLCKSYEEMARNDQLDDKDSWADNLKNEYNLYIQEIQSHMQ